jgi:hypothetical protein
MKIQNTLAFVAVTAITTLFVGQARAQFPLAANDGVAASPKVRAMLNERARTTSSAGVTENTASKAVRPTSDIAASPKVSQMLSETKARTTAPAAAALAVTQPRTTDDGIAASPKVRAQLNERSNPEIQIAPLK